jgi:hypothetical protein
MVTSDVDASTRSAAIAIMSSFAERTGLTSRAQPKRYLWTDAFALCNWLQLHHNSPDKGYAELASRLIDQVHFVLGRHRADDSRSGWLSGLSEDEGALHPTLGGLRIGKPLPERRPDDPFDERLEWERDGQYFHYLTKWIDALVRASVILDQSRYRVHAEELAKAIFPPFLQISPTGRPVGITWKMSTDLSRPLVVGMNPHDCLDGYVTYRFIEEAGRRSPGSQLSREIGALRQLSAHSRWATSDPLGIGGLLLDAFRLALLPPARTSDAQLLRDVLAGAEAGLQQFLKGKTLQGRPSMRLAFRELGLAIGLQTVPATKAALSVSGILDDRMAASVEALLSPGEVDRAMVDMWSQPDSHTNSTWQDHRNINEVMLAAAILHAQVGTAPRPTAF